MGNYRTAFEETEFVGGYIPASLRKLLLKEIARTGESITQCLTRILRKELVKK